MRARENVDDKGPLKMLESLKMTDRTRNVLRYASMLAARSSRVTINPDDILFSLALDPKSIATVALFRHSNDDLRSWARNIQGELVSTSADALLELSERSLLIMVLAGNETTHFGHHFIGTEHLLLACALDKEAAEWFKRFAIDRLSVCQEVVSLLGENFKEWQRGHHFA